MVILWMVYYYITRFLNLCKNLGIDWKTPPLDGSWEWFLESLWNFKKHQPRRWSWGTGNVLGEIHNTWWLSQPEGSFTGLFTQLLPEQNKHLSRGGSDVKPLCHPHLRPVRAPVECLLRFGPDTKAFFCRCFVCGKFQTTRTKATQSISHQILHYHTIFRACLFFFHDLYSWEIFQCGLVVKIEMVPKRFFSVWWALSLQVQPSACACYAHYGISKSHQEQKWLAQKAR